MKYIFRILQIILILISVGSATTCHASEEMEKTNLQFKWGPKVGLDFMQADKWYSTKGHDPDESFLGVSAGATFRFSWNKHFYFQPAILMQFDNASASVKQPKTFDKFTSDRVLFDISRLALQLPLHLGYRFSLAGDFGMSVFTGCFIQYGITGQFTCHDTGLGNDYPRYRLYGNNGIWNRWNFGGVLGVTFELGDYFTVSGDGNFGLKKMNRRDIFVTKTLNEAIGRVALSYWIAK